MISSSELADKIIEKAKLLGASTVGIASVESLQQSPSHKIYPKIGKIRDGYLNDAHKSTHDIGDMCPEDAVSVVVIGVEHSDDEPELDWWDGKGTSGNRILIRVNKRLSEWIEDTYSIKTYKMPYFVEKGGIFLKDAAVYAGLGCIGRNNLVITPEYGPRVRLRALLLTREAKPTGPVDFNPCEKCEEYCRKACPVSAFQNTLYSAKALGQHLLPGINGTYDRNRCNIKMEKDIDEAAEMKSTDDDNLQETRQLIYQMERSHVKTADSDEPFTYCVKYCRKCELSCPVGAQ